MIDTAILAGSLVTSFLAPYAKMGLEKLVVKFANNLGESAAKKTGELTGKIIERVQANMAGPAEKPTMDLMKEHADQVAPTVELLLKDKLDKDANLAKELQELLEEFKRVRGASSGGTSVEIFIRDHNFNNNQGTISITGINKG